MNVLSTIHVIMEERALTPLEATNAHAEQSTPEETAKRVRDISSVDFPFYKTSDFMFISHKLHST